MSCILKADRIKDNIKEIKRTTVQSISKSNYNVDVQNMQTI